ncbi:unnamed protein product [Closterium sp. Naga37s-1]|nr:unnamed protein product [Closterium sp. Naga37s-1]
MRLTVSMSLCVLGPPPPSRLGLVKVPSKPLSLSPLSTTLSPTHSLSTALNRTQTFSTHLNLSYSLPHLHTLPTHHQLSSCSKLLSSFYPSPSHPFTTSSSSYPSSSSPPPPLSPTPSSSYPSPLSSFPSFPSCSSCPSTPPLLFTRQDPFLPIIRIH